MQLQRTDRQNLTLDQKQSDEESLECKETLTEPFPDSNQNRIKHCGCRCRCNLEQLSEDPAEKKRQKRKEYKRRQKQKQKLGKEKALLSLEKIIRDIYGRRANFKMAQKQIEECVKIEKNEQRLCKFIHMVIRDEVELIRKQITLVLHRYETQQNQQSEAVRTIFEPIERMITASIEIQKLINFFMESCSNQEETSISKNFGRAMLRFLVKTDLIKSATFSRICFHICRSSPEEYRRQKEVIDYIKSVFDHQYDPTQPLPQSSDTQEDNEEYLDQEDEQEEDGSTIESPNYETDEKEEELQKDMTSDRGKRNRKQRRRKLKQQIECDFQSISKRIQQMNVDKQTRALCIVSEECVARIRKRKLKYETSNNNEQYK